MAGGARNGHSGDDYDAIAHGRGKRVADPELVRLLHDRMTRIEDQTVQDRRDATDQRHDFRAEVQLSIHSMQGDMRDGFKGLAASISKLHERLNGLFWFFLSIAGVLILLLLGIVGFLFTRQMGW